MSPMSPVAGPNAGHLVKIVISVKTVFFWVKVFILERLDKLLEVFKTASKKYVHGDLERSC